MAMTWIRVCAAADIAPGEALSVDVNPPIAVYNIDGEFLATGEMCTHANASLAEDGYIEGAEVECSWHMARFCLRTGKALSPPATEPLVTYVTKVENGQVYIDVP